MYILLLYLLIYLIIFLLCIYIGIYIGIYIDIFREKIYKNKDVRKNIIIFLDTYILVKQITTIKKNDILEIYFNCIY